MSKKLNYYKLNNKYDKIFKNKSKDELKKLIIKQKEKHRKILEAINSLYGFGKNVIENKELLKSEKKELLEMLQYNIDLLEEKEEWPQRYIIKRFKQKNKEIYDELCNEFYKKAIIVED